MLQEGRKEGKNEGRKEREEEEKGTVILCIGAYILRAS